MESIEEYKSDLNVVQEEIEECEDVIDDYQTRIECLWEDKINILSAIEELEREDNEEY